METTTEELIKRVREAQAAADRANANLVEAKREMLGHLEATKTKTAFTQVGNEKVTATFSTRTTYSIDEDGLKEAIGARKFATYTERKVNRKKIEDALDNGKLAPEVVMPFITAKTSAPYLTFTVKEVTENE